MRSMSARAGSRAPWAGRGRRQGTLHLHLDAQARLEVSVLKVPVGEIRRIADRITAERGVRYRQLRLLMLDERAGDG